MPEMIDVLDNQYKITGHVLSRDEVHEQELIHASVFVWVYNKSGEVLLQLRAADKDMLPNVWDVSVGGHITAGETALETAVRESEEEIGLQVDANDIEGVGTILDEVPMVNGKIHKQICWVYVLESTIDLESLHIQESELAGLKWVSIEDILTAMKTPDFTDTYSNRNKDIYLKAFSKIYENLGKK